MENLEDRPVPSSPRNPFQDLCSVVNSGSQYHSSSSSTKVYGEGKKSSPEHAPKEHFKTPNSSRGANGKVRPVHKSRNPFEVGLLDRLGKEIWSPSVTDTSPSNDEGKPFRWPIEHLAAICPVAIDPSLHVSESPRDPAMESQAQVVIQKFFDTTQLVPSPVDDPVNGVTCRKGVSLLMSNESEELLSPYLNFARDQTKAASLERLPSSQESTLRRKLFRHSDALASPRRPRRRTGSDSEITPIRDQFSSSPIFKEGFRTSTTPPPSALTTPPISPIGKSPASLSEGVTRLQSSSSELGGSEHDHCEDGSAQGNCTVDMSHCCESEDCEMEVVEEEATARDVSMVGDSTAFRDTGYQTSSFSRDCLPNTLSMQYSESMMEGVESNMYQTSHTKGWGLPQSSSTPSNEGHLW